MTNDLNSKMRRKKRDPEFPVHGQLFIDGHINCCHLFFVSTNYEEL